MSEKPKENADRVQAEATTKTASAGVVDGAAVAALEIDRAVEAFCRSEAEAFASAAFADTATWTHLQSSLTGNRQNRKLRKR